jgi:hypothetical protein
MNKIILFIILFSMFFALDQGNAQTTQNIVQAAFQQLGTVNSWTNSPTGDATPIMLNVQVWEDLTQNEYLRREYYNEDGTLKTGNTQNSSGTNVSDISYVINRNNQNQVLENEATQIAVSGRVAALNERYGELITILRNIEETRAEINIYLGQTTTGDHMDKPHPKHMDTLAYWKHRREEKEGEIASTKDVARTETGQGVLGWFVTPPSGGGGN